VLGSAERVLTEKYTCVQVCVEVKAKSINFNKGGKNGENGEISEGSEDGADGESAKSARKMEVPKSHRKQIATTFIHGNWDPG
jgi:hypothetical protein